MAKELPYFKFEPSEWEAGNIQAVSRESKGLFIEICSLYWIRLGELPYALALQKLCNGNAKHMEELCTLEIIGVKEGQIHIEFLDEQLDEFQKTSEKRAKAANKRWKNASALQVQSKSNAIREEEIKGEKMKKEEKPIPFSDEVMQTYYDVVDYFPSNTKPKDDSTKNKWLEEIRKMIEIDNLDPSSIVHVSRLAREDDFWCKNFLTIGKLRKKNKEGVKYFDVFVNKFKANGGTNELSQQAKRMQQQFPDTNF